MVMQEALGKMKNSKEKNMCWQDGRLFEDKEDWVVDSCTKCTCQVGANNCYGNMKGIYRTSTESLETDIIIYYPGVQDCVSPNYMPPSRLCQPVLHRWRVLPRVFA